MVKNPACQCPNAQSLFGLLGKKWVMFILGAIDHGAHSFTEIRRDIGEANTRILSERLQELIIAGVIEKNPNGHYTLTTSGSLLIKKLLEIADWWGGVRVI